MVATAPHYALEQAQDAAHGGVGWQSRAGTTADELGSVWAACGVASECGVLRAVLMHRPGAEIDGITDAAGALWHDLLDPPRARDQHDRLADLYRGHGVAVHEVGEVPRDKPNSYFCRDVFAMTPMGAILARPASASRAGEERQAAAALARIGVPILHSVAGGATFEGADVAVESADLVFVAEGQRTNREGARQVARAFSEAGVAQVEIVQLPYGCGHLDGMLNIIDRDLALIYPTQLPWRIYEVLKERGFRFLDVPDAGEARHGMAINMVPLAPGVVLMPAGNPVTRAALESCGVTCLEAEVDELMKGAGSVHCMTGVVHREAV
ncbi:MAG: amidinotransferase [Chloroflexia bacterium]|nr:amidinotransferase [Chloroflexia bacterium]